MARIEFVKRDVTLEEIRESTLEQRIYFEWANHWNTDWSRLAPNFNPLYWCVMDVLKLIYAPVLLLVIWPLLLVPAIIYTAHKDKNISGPKDDPHGWHISRAKWMEIGVELEK